MHIAERFRLSEESAEIAVGGRIRQMIVWQIGPRTPELAAALTRIREGTQNVCGATINTGPADGDVVVTATEGAERQP